VTTHDLVMSLLLDSCCEIACVSHRGAGACKRELTRLGVLQLSDKVHELLVAMNAHLCC